MSLNIFLFFLLTLFIKNGFQQNIENEIVCRNEITGDALDWFTLYKLPKLNTNSLFKNGTAYAFMTNQKQNWFLSQLSINSTLSFPAKTLEQLYDTNNKSGSGEFGYIL